MKISVYSTAWNIIKHSFDYKGCLDNWASFADEISIAVGISEDNTYEALESYAKEKSYPVNLIKTYYDFNNDPFAYGKTENAALQNCTGDLLIQQNGDEKMSVSREKLEEIYKFFNSNYHIKAVWIPVVNLYGCKEKALDCAKKWYIHMPGLFRGPVNWAIKNDGHPDYHKTSTDELIDITGNLVETATILNNISFQTIKPYMDDGWPVVIHEGYLTLKDRLDRSIWWKNFWNKSTNGDTNSHPTSIEELAAKQSIEHGLNLERVYGK